MVLIEKGNHLVVYCVGKTMWIYFVTWASWNCTPQQAWTEGTREPGRGGRHKESQWSVEGIGGEGLTKNEESLSPCPETQHGGLQRRHSCVHNVHESNHEQQSEQPCLEWFRPRSMYSDYFSSVSLEKRPIMLPKIYPDKFLIEFITSFIHSDESQYSSNPSIPQ